MTTHIEYLRQLVATDAKNIRAIVASEEISVSGSSVPDAVARWLAREWAVCEAFCIVRSGWPIREVKRWRTCQEELIEFESGIVHVIRNNAEQLTLRIFTPDIRDILRLGPIHQALGEIKGQSGRFIVHRPLPPSRQGFPNENRRHA